MFVVASSCSLCRTFALLRSSFSRVNDGEHIDGVWVEDRDAGRREGLPGDGDDDIPFTQGHRARYGDKST